MNVAQRLRELTPESTDEEILVGIIEALFRCQGSNGGGHIGSTLQRVRSANVEVARFEKGNDAEELRRAAREDGSYTPADNAHVESEESVRPHFVLAEVEEPVEKAGDGVIGSHFKPKRKRKKKAQEEHDDA